MSSDSQVVESWISSFCSLIGHEYFAEVSEDFIEDDFNLTGLASQVPMYKEALEMILDVEPEEDDDEEEEEDDEDDDEELGEEHLEYRRAGDRRHMRANHDISVIENSAELLYGLIHQRYICSRPGIGQMHEKYEAGHFGSCPRVFCHGCKVLPVGCNDTPGSETVKLYCPSCFDIYTPPNSRFQTVDGAFFGTTFGCLFFMTFPDLQYNSRSANALSPSSTASDRNAVPMISPPNQPDDIHGVALANFAPGLGGNNIYEPRIYGFRLNERAKTGPRMKWLRMKPNDIRELDEASNFFADTAIEDDEMADDETPVKNDGTDELSASQQAAPPAEAQQKVNERKMAPIKRRKRISSEEGAVLNGVG